MHDHPARPDEAEKEKFRGEIPAADLLGEQCQIFEHGQPIELAAPRISPAKAIRQLGHR